MNWRHNYLKALCPLRTNGGEIHECWHPFYNGDKECCNKQCFHQSLTAFSLCHHFILAISNSSDSTCFCVSLLLIVFLTNFINISLFTFECTLGLSSKYPKPVQYMSLTWPNVLQSSWQCFLSKPFRIFFQSCVNSIS